MLWTYNFSIKNYRDQIDCKKVKTELKVLFLRRVLLMYVRPRHTLINHFKKFFYGKMKKLPTF